MQASDTEDEREREDAVSNDEMGDILGQPCVGGLEAREQRYCACDESAICRERLTRIGSK